MERVTERFDFTFQSSCAKKPKGFSWPPNCTVPAAPVSGLYAPTDSWKTLSCTKSRRLLKAKPGRMLAGVKSPCSMPLAPSYPNFSVCLPCTQPNTDRQLYIGPRYSPGPHPPPTAKPVRLPATLTFGTARFASWPLAPPTLAKAKLDSHRRLELKVWV